MRAMVEVEGTQEPTFAEFFAAKRHVAERQAFAITRDPVEAQDIAAEAFARMWRVWESTGIDYPTSYLYMTVRSVAMDRFRRAAREGRALSQLAPPTATRSEPAVEARAVLDRLLPELSEGQRRTLVLRYLEDLSEAETAAALDLPRGTVKSLASRGLRRLRELEAASAA